MTEKKLPRSNISAYVKKYIQLCIGAVIAALGLELFLIPNEVIDGGVVGLSIMAQYITGLPLGVFLVVFNLPFLRLANKQIGKDFVVATIVAIIFLSIWSEV
ncbi:MAG: YitT family protein, partial [Selenomonadaceae bacterium]|nr:YitT family protein [Selenomonadaceae bacterium]